MAEGSRKGLALAVILSFLLTTALLYSTFEVPKALDEVLRHYFPEVFWDVEAREGVLATLRPVGYAALATTIALMVLGFAVKKGFLSLAGSLALYIPTFGYFASAMFFLTGLGALRALWLPMLELSPAVLKLGCVAYLPFAALGSFAAPVGVVLIFAGLLVFALGATTWLYGKFRGRELVDFWIYKYSRHPQYLGFIVWSYGMLIFVSYKHYVRGAFTTPPALIWLISTMVVIGAALLEEVRMSERHGERYEDYCEKTPFMVPMPKQLARALVAPLRAVRVYPKDAKSVAMALALYTAIVMLTSYALSLLLQL